MPVSSKLILLTKFAGDIAIAAVGSVSSFLSKLLFLFFCQNLYCFF